MEHPFDGSWGYQGKFFPNLALRRSPVFMALVEAFHQAGIGVILDWVPSSSRMTIMVSTYSMAPTRTNTPICGKASTPTGTAISSIISAGRSNLPDQQCALLARPLSYRRTQGRCCQLDAEAQLLRKEGEWEPNEHGGDGNLEAIAFIKDLNQTLYRDFPDIQTSQRRRPTGRRYPPYLCPTVLASV